MPKKETPPPAEIHVVEFPPGEFKPLYVAGKDIGKVVIGLSPKTAANWRSERRGMKYTIVNGHPYYAIADIAEFFSRNLVQTTGE